LTYESDALVHLRAIPGAVVLPQNTEEVQAVVRLCYREGVPFVARGHGTGLSGGATPTAGGVVVSLARMDRILQVDPEGQRVVVEPGVANLDVTRAVAADGFFYAPDPSSQQVCTIGGNVAENSGGAHCFKHGFTVHHVTGLTLVLPDGDAVELGSAALDPDGPDLLGLVVGSEGTLGIATRITLRIVRSPEVVRTLLAGFETTDAAGAAVSGIVAAGILPSALEMMDRLTIEAAERAVAPGYPAGAGAVIDRLVLASNNAGKLREFRRLLEPLGYDVVPQAELGIAEADEPHVTFIENALAKARHASTHSGLPALADDSGICVDALGGAPGVLSARYAGEPKSDARNNEALVSALQGVADRRAHYYCVLVLVRHTRDPQPIVAEGIWHGTVVDTPRGSGGFGYDPHFEDRDSRLTGAELPLARKNELSHRGQALRALIARLGEERAA